MRFRRRLGRLVGKRRALMGSTFDPPHLGHLDALTLVFRTHLFDEVVMSAAGSTPLLKEDVTDGLDRQQLALLAFDHVLTADPMPGYPTLKMDMSAIMGIDTPTALRYWAFQERYPNDEHVFITGSDAITQRDGGLPIMAWRYQELLREVPIYIIPRAGFAQPSDTELPSEFNMEWLPGDYSPLRDIRSSDIQRLIRIGEPWDHLVLPQVASYIRREKLYVKRDTKG